LGRCPLPAEDLMRRPPDQHLEELFRHLAELQADLDRLRAEQARPQRRWRLSPWLGAPLVIVATWTLSAQSPGAVPTDIEERLRALEKLVRRGAGNATQITAPFDVIGTDGKPILRVSAQYDFSVPVGITKVAANGGGHISASSGGVAQAVLAAAPSGHGVVTALDEKQIVRAGLGGQGSVVVNDPAGKQIAGLTQGEGGGRVGIWRGDKRVIDITTDAAGGGIVKVNKPSGQTLAQIGADAQNGGAGGVKVMSSSGQVTAGLLGGVRSAGSVVVATSAGKPVAELSVAQDGRGLVQVFDATSKSIAVLTQAVDAPGGLLQISHTSGKSVANLTVSESGGGYLQLSNPAGLPTVEGGTLSSGKGYVRAGPTYKCGSNLGLGVVGGAILPPDCIVGFMK
jgi:hypothetical protein